jgi:hypothetical protein
VIRPQFQESLLTNVLGATQNEGMRRLHAVQHEVLRLELILREVLQQEPRRNRRSEVVYKGLSLIFARSILKASGLEEIIEV